MRATGHVLAAALCAAATSAGAAVFDGTHDPLVRVCFVGNAVTAKPDDVAFVWRHMKLIENYGNIRFEMMPDGGRCPPPTKSQDGKLEVHDGDLRIGIPGTVDYDDKTPINSQLGLGCAQPLNKAWWSNFPGNKHRPNLRACRLTTYVGGRMPLNKILHELGHAIGMFHEHERTDIPMDDPMVATCFKDVKYFGKYIAPGRDATTLVTPYDRESVVHYEINFRIDKVNVAETSKCNIGNDNGNTGMSRFDQLGIRIMYPHDRRVAEVRGKRVVAVGEQVNLQNEWGALGALVDNVVKNPVWTVTRDNVPVTEQRKPDFTYKFATPGRYAIRYTFTDSKGRGFANSFALDVLPPDRMRGLQGSLTAARASIF